ncbi:metallophosphoesterase family protein [Roseateles koreensis]|uniref:Metallophosphoesterase family protein n=1 Tax=Roseateles koreensis TaxID=2987526 RepID=A0ABT5KSX6_9BURK|nr:metallophosphoesterase family protein [Roseateles koreensis]MDC8786043.1 metallophosphoesterase family protein [Roseateles koreensis]
MKIALISDLHANREAFTAVLEHAQGQGVGDYALLGDFVGYGGDPAWVVDRVRALVDAGAIAVMGNHDQAAIKGAAPTMHEEAREAVAWTHAQLSAEQRDWLAQLPMSVIRDDRLYVHANAYAPSGWEYIQGRMEAMRSLQATECRYTFCGHMHEPMLYHLSGTGKAGEFTPAPGTPIPLLPNRQWLVVPGSCGQPRDGNPAACYAIFDSVSSELSFQRVPYDIEAAAQRIRAAGLPERLAQRLSQGQ